MSLCQRRTSRQARDGFNCEVLWWNSFVTVNSTVTVKFSHYLSKTRHLISHQFEPKLNHRLVSEFLPLGQSIGNNSLPSPPPSADMSVALPCFPPGLSIVAKSLCVCILSYFHISTATQPSQRSLLMCEVKATWNECRVFLKRVLIIRHC